MPPSLMSLSLMSLSPAVVFVAHAAATWWMAGLIWMVQVVHYPLMGAVGPAAFAEYHRQHVALISFVVIPPMLVELAGAAWLLAARPDWMPGWAAILGLALVAVAWVSTFALSVPAHDALGRGFSADALSRLVSTNGVRTVAWTLRGGLVAWLLAGALTR